MKKNYLQTSNGKMDDLKPMTIKDLMAYLKWSLENGIASENEQVFLASDEEGNSFHKLVGRGIQLHQEGLTLYPLTGV